MSTASQVDSPVPVGNGTKRRSPLMRKILRTLVIIHRWIGIFACLLFVVWFESAFVLMYVQFPAMNAAEKLATLPPVKWDAVRVTPEEALQIALVQDFPELFWLESSGGEPIYRFHDWDGSIHAVSAVDGRKISRVEPAAALQIVQSNLSAPNASLLKSDLASDQWTVTGYWDEKRPFHVVALNDAQDTHYYVSVATGEIVLDTVRWERFWNYLGAIPHWIYFEFIRWDTDMWAWVVIILSGIGIFGAASGLWLGVTRIRIRRHRLYGGRKVTPFIGWMKWHHVAGVIGGVFLFAWIVTGLLSMYPGGFLEQRGVTRDELQSYAGNSQPHFPELGLDALSAQSFNAAYAQFLWINGQPRIMLRDNKMQVQMVNGASGEPLEIARDDLYEAARNLMPGVTMTSAEYLTAPTEYWHTAFKPMEVPVIKVEFDDDAKTWFFINPESGAVEGILDKVGRLDRWANWGVHDVDLLVLHKYRPLWDIVVWILLAAGLFISTSGAVIGTKRLVFDIKDHRRKNKIASRAQADLNSSSPVSG